MGPASDSESDDDIVLPAHSSHALLFTRSVFQGTANKGLHPPPPPPLPHTKRHSFHPPSSRRPPHPSRSGCLHFPPQSSPSLSNAPSLTKEVLSTKLFHLQTHYHSALAAETLRHQATLNSLAANLDAKSSLAVRDTEAKAVKGAEELVQCVGEMGWSGEGGKHANRHDGRLYYANKLNTTIPDDDTSINLSGNGDGGHDFLDRVARDNLDITTDTENTAKMPDQPLPPPEREEPAIKTPVYSKDVKKLVHAYDSEEDD